MSDQPQLAAQLRRWEWLLVLVVFLAGLLAFLPGANGDFIYDDNVEIRNVDDVFTPGAWPHLFVTAYSRLYRPVKYLSCYADNALFGWHSSGWHWQSFLWHALNGALVFLLARRLRASAVGALLGAAWFALHPVHAETVVWISARGALQSTFGVLAALLCYARWRECPSAWAAAGLLASAFVGFFAKEDALMIFPVIALYEFFIRREKPLALLRQKTFLAPALALTALAAVYLTLRQSIILGFAQGRHAAGLGGWFSTLPVILVAYLRQLVWPDPMCIDQPVDFSAGYGAVFWISILVLTACAAALCVRRVSWSRWQFALGFFFVALAPVSGLIPINQPRADRFLYLPSVAGALALAWAWDWAATQKIRRLGAVIFFSATFFWFGWRAWDYSKTFANETALWRNAVDVNPKSWRGYANLAAAANNTGQPEAALALIEKALALNPQYPEAWIIKGYSLALLGRTAEAETWYRRAVAQDTEKAEWLFLLADLLQRQHRNAEAEQLYDRIVQIRPAYTDARLAAGVLAIEMNKSEKAEAHWNAVLQFDPANSQARQNLELLRRGKKSPAKK